MVKQNENLSSGDKLGTNWGHFDKMQLMEAVVMAKVLIGNFATWEKDNDGRCTYHYSDSSVPRLSNTNLPIINVIIDNCLRNDNFIKSAEIANELERQNITGYDKEVIKKAIQRIKKKAFWKDVIVTSSSGYRIIIKSDASNNSISNQDVVNNDEERNVNSIDRDDKSSKTHTEITQGLQSTISFERTDAYISSFLKNNGRTRTYYYSNAPREYKDVYSPTQLKNKEDDSDTVINISCMKESPFRYIISGPIGSGKTLLAGYIAAEVAKKYSKQHIIPIVFDLGSFSDTSDTLYDLLKKEFDSYIPNDEHNIAQSLVKAFTTSEFLIHCQQGSVLVIIDGLDKLSPELNKLFLIKLQDFLKTYSDNSVIIMSRPTSRFIDFRTFTVLTIHPLYGKKAEALIDRFISPYDGMGKIEFREHVLDNNDELFESAHLFANPLFLSIYSSIFKMKNFYHIPGLHHSIETFIRYATGEDKFNNHHRYSMTKMTPSQLRKELASFCFYLVFNDISSFDIDVFDEYRKKMSSDDDYSSEYFLNDLCRMYGLTEFEDGSYSFIDSLIVEYFYVNYIRTYDSNLSSVEHVFDNNVYYDQDSILELLGETTKPALVKNIYCPVIEELLDGADVDVAYKRYLEHNFDVLEYYIGLGNYETDNQREDIIFKYLVKDLRAEQDIDHLKFPPIEEYKIEPVYLLNADDAQRIGEYEGLYHESYFDKAYKESLNLTPMGYLYYFDVNHVLNGEDDNSKRIREIIMSEDFPLRREFDEMILAYQLIEEGDWSYYP